MREFKIPCYLILVFFTQLCTKNGHAQPQSGSILPADTAVCAPMGVFTIPAIYPHSFLVTQNLPGYQGYTLTDIPISPDNVNLGTNIPLADDAFAGPFDMGFGFSFYGVTYTSIYISSNGWVGFSPPLSNYYTTDIEAMEAAPCGSGYPEAGIFGMLQDWAPAVGGNVRYSVAGIAPNRRFVISWVSVPFFGSCVGTATFQIQLCETTNIIQIQLINKPACTEMWAGDSRSGIQSACNQEDDLCFQFIQNGPDMAFSNEAYQFTPQVPVDGFATANFTGIDWVCILGNGSLQAVTSSDTTANANLINASQAPKRYIATVNYSILCGPSFSYTDTFTISLKPHDASFVADTSVLCLGDASLIEYNGAATLNGNVSVIWDWDGGTAIPGTGLGPHSVTWITTGTKTVSLTLSDGGCGIDSKTLAVDVGPDASFITGGPVCLGDSSTIYYLGNPLLVDSGSVIWDWGNADAFPGTGLGPHSVAWESTGIQTISLSIDGVCGAASDSSILEVSDPIVASLLSDEQVCVADTALITYSGPQLPSGTSITWNWNGGFATPGTGPGPHQVKWYTAGIKTVTVSISAPCNSDTAATTIEVLSADNCIITGSGVANNRNLHFYPNPANDIIYLENVIQSAIVSLYDVTGRLVNQKTISDSFFGIADISGGTYIICIDQNDTKSFGKLVISR